MKVVLAFAPGSAGTVTAQSLAASAARTPGVCRVECGLAVEAQAPIAGLVEVWGPAAEALAKDLASRDLLGVWRVDPSDPIPAPQPIAETGLVPGIRLVSLCKRIASVDVLAFERHWRGRHRDIALSFAVLPSGYRQDVVTEVLHGAAIDGVAGLHFRSREQFDERYLLHPEDAARGMQDARRFLDVAGSLSFFTSVRVQSSEQRVTGPCA